MSTKRAASPPPVNHTVHGRHDEVRIATARPPLPLFVTLSDEQIAERRRLIEGADAELDTPSIPPVPTILQRAKNAASAAKAAATQRTINAIFSVAGFAQEVKPVQVIQWVVFIGHRITSYMSIYRSGGWHMLYKELSTRYRHMSDTIFDQLMCVQTWPEVADVLRSHCRLVGSKHQKEAESLKNKAKEVDDTSRRAKERIQDRLCEARENLQEERHSKDTGYVLSSSGSDNDSQASRNSFASQKRRNIRRWEEKIDKLEAELRVLNVDVFSPPTEVQCPTDSPSALNDRIENKMIMRLVVELSVLSLLKVLGHDSPSKPTPKPWSKECCATKLEGPSAEERVARRFARLGKVSKSGTFQYDDFFLRIPASMKQSWFDACQSRGILRDSEEAQIIIRGWVSRDLDNVSTRDEYDSLTPELYKKSLEADELAERIERQHAKDDYDEFFVSAADRARQEKADYLDADFQGRVGLEGRVNLTDKTLQAAIAAGPKCHNCGEAAHSKGACLSEQTGSCPRCGDKGHFRNTCNNPNPYKCSQCGGDHQAHHCDKAKCAKCSKYARLTFNMCLSCRQNHAKGVITKEANVSVLTQEFMKVQPESVAYFYRRDDPTRATQSVGVKVGEGFIVARHLEVAPGMYAARVRMVDNSVPGEKRILWDPRVFDVDSHKVYDGDAQMLKLRVGKQVYDPPSLRYVSPMDGEALFVGITVPFAPVLEAEIGVKSCVITGITHTANTVIGHCGSFLLQNNSFVGVHFASQQTKAGVKVNMFTAVAPRDKTPSGSLGFFRLGLS